MLQNEACLLEGARQVGKTTIVEHFAKNEYKSYIKIDFANTTRRNSRYFFKYCEVGSAFFATADRDRY